MKTWLKTILLRWGKNYRIIILKFILTFSLLFFVLYYAGVEEIFRNVNSIDVLTILEILTILTLQQFISAYRWHLILKTVGEDYSAQPIILIFMIASVANSLLLTSIAGLSSRVILLKKLGTSVKNAIYSLGFEKFYTSVTLMISLLAGVAVLAINETAMPLHSFQYSIYFCTGALALLVLGLFIFLNFQTGKVEELREMVHQVIVHPRYFFIFVLLSVVIVGLGFASIAIIANGLEVDVSLVALVAVQPGIAIMTSIPLFMGGWGIREASMVLGLGLLGVTAGDALAISLTYGLLGILATFSAAGISLLLGIRK